MSDVKRREFITLLGARRSAARRRAQYTPAQSRLYLSELQNGDCFSHRAILSGRVSGYAARANRDCGPHSEGDPAQGAAGNWLLRKL